MNWSDLIVPAVGTAIGAAGAYFALDKRQAVAEAVLTTKLDAMTSSITALKAEHTRSASDQGSRLEALRDDVGTLMDFKSRTEGATEKEREMDNRSGVVRNR